MTATEVLDYLRANEIAIVYRGGHLRLSPPAKVTEELAQGITANREELVWLIQRRLPVDETRPAHEVWLTDVIWDEWDWRKQKHQPTAMKAAA